MAKINGNYEVAYILKPELGEEATAALPRPGEPWPRWTSGASAGWPIPSTT